MNVLLVYPQFPETYWGFRHALPFIGKKAVFPPLGLMTVSAMLPRDWKRRLVDLNVQPLRKADLDWADLVFASAMLVQHASLREVIDRCKAAGKRVVVGGPGVTTSAGFFADVDHIFLGEAEPLLPEFLRDLESGHLRRVYQSEERPQLSESPLPDFHLATLKHYSSMAVQFSRGCPFQCEFCDIIEIFGRVPRTKSNEQMLAELDALRDTGWRGPVFIVDDNFIGNKRNVRNFLPALADWSERNGTPFYFFTEASVNLADDAEILRGMRRAGFQRVFLGIETPVEECLKETKKGQNTGRDLLAAVKTIQHHGIEVMAGFIVGFDHDPDDIFDRMIAFIRESAIPFAMVGLLTALPGTQLWRRLTHEGRLLEESTGNNTDGSLNFIPRMDPTRLIEGYKSILATIYHPAEYYRRALECLKRVDRQVLPFEGRQLFEHIRIVLRVFFKLGLWDRERVEFWRFMREVIAAHRNRFTLAVTLAVMGYHFRRHTDHCLGARAGD